MKPEKILKAIDKLSDEEKNAIFSKLGIGEETEEVETNTSEEVKQDEPLKEESQEQPIETDKKEEVVETKEEEKQVPDKTTEGVVEDANVEDLISVDDIATKDFVKEFIASEMAKYKSLEDENTKLKDELSKMSDKYEKQDFGNETQKVDLTGNSNSNGDYVSFAEYSKKFM